MEELRRRCFECLSEALQHGTVRPGELEGAVWEYYRNTAPSLQEFYSRYTPEWEVFYEHEQLLPSDFLDFLYRMQSAFRKRYALAELDVLYYIERLERLPLLSPERKRLQELFWISGIACSRTRSTIISIITLNRCARALPCSTSRTD